MTDGDNSVFGERHLQPGTVSTGLLDGVKADLPDAWSRLADRYAPLVYFWCRKHGLQAADSEDVVQEVFRTVAARIEEFRREREGDTFRGWLRTITRHKLGDFFRNEQRRQKAAGGTDAGEMMRQHPDLRGNDEPIEMEVPGESRLLYRRVLGLIRADFGERTWQAFSRVVVDGVAPQDVAAELEMSVNAVYLARSRILRRVRAELGAEPQ